MWARKKSIWVYVFSSGGCNGCDIEIISAFSPRYDAERFGIIEVPSPKHADVLLVTGALRRKSVELLKNIYEQIPPPKRVIAVGNCAICGGPFAKSKEVLGGIGKVIPVDLKIGGCPPRPSLIIKGILKVMEIERGRRSCKKNEK